MFVFHYSAHIDDIHLHTSEEVCVTTKKKVKLAPNRIKFQC